MDAYLKKHKGKVGEELADVLYWVLLMAHDFEIDLAKNFEKKMLKNAKKYPVNKFRGKHPTKHNKT